LTTVAPVVSIFVDKDISASAAVFLEDLLCCIHNQLPHGSPESSNHFKEYETACRYGESIAKRSRLLRTAVASRLETNHHTFLVLDGYDRVSEGLQVLLDRELSDLRAHRLHVLLTRRVPAFELPRDKNCDVADCDEKDLKIYWVSTLFGCNYRSSKIGLTSSSRAKHVRHSLKASVSHTYVLNTRRALTSDPPLL
jgi:hypothetical protein